MHYRFCCPDNMQWSSCWSILSTIGEAVIQRYCHLHPGLPPVHLPVATCSWCCPHCLCLLHSCGLATCNLQPWVPSIYVFRTPVVLLVLVCFGSLEIAQCFLFPVHLRTPVVALLLLEIFNLCYQGQYFLLIFIWGPLLSCSEEDPVFVLGEVH